MAFTLKKKTRNKKINKKTKKNQKRYKGGASSTPEQSVEHSDEQSGEKKETEPEPLAPPVPEPEIEAPELVEPELEPVVEPESVIEPEIEAPEVIEPTVVEPVVVEPVVAEPEPADQPVVETPTSKKFYDKINAKIQEMSQIEDFEDFDINLIKKGNCNFDIETNANLYKVLKRSYNLFMSQFSGQSNNHENNIFDDSSISNELFNFLSVKITYLKILYLTIYYNTNDQSQTEGIDPEKFLKDYLMNNTFKDMEEEERKIKVNEIIIEIQELYKNIIEFKTTQTIVDKSPDEIIEFKLLCVITEIFSQTMRELGNISVTINKDEIYDNKKNTITNLYSQESYLYLEKIITNIIKLPISSIFQFAIFSIIPASTDLIAFFTDQTFNIFDHSLSDEEMVDLGIGLINYSNDPETNIKGKSKVELQKLINEPTSYESQKINEIFDNNSVIDKTPKLFDYFNKGNYINIHIDDSVFIAETTDAWVLKFNNGETDYILGYILLLTTYDFNKLTVTSNYQFRWYIPNNEINTKMMKSINKEYFLPECINYPLPPEPSEVSKSLEPSEPSLLSNETQMNPQNRGDINKQAIDLFPKVVIGSIGLVGATIGTLIGLGIAGGNKTKNKRKKKSYNKIKLNKSKKNKKNKTK